MSHFLDNDPAWGPTGKTVFERTYSRDKQNGDKEEWADTTARTARGNLELVYGPQESWSAEVWREYRELHELFYAMKDIPAGRHLWASGVPGRQYLFNCHVSHWDEKFSTHFDFTFMRLMEGGGVGANYSSKYVDGFEILRQLQVHIVCDPSHPDYEKMLAAGVLSSEYSSDWPGAWEVEDSREGWSAAMVDLIDTYTTTDTVKHAQRVYDVTNVRCEGSRLKTFGGRASGPLPFAVMMHEISAVLNNAARHGWVTPLDCMEIDHSIAKCVVSGGNRRSARMAMVHWNDPYILEFIDCKNDPSKHWTTNISVEIDEDFIYWFNRYKYAVEHDVPVNDIDERAIHAKCVMLLATEAMLRNGEPGFWNSSLSNEGEPGLVVCTNPCGEIALMPWENCNLGHINLDAFSPTEKGGNYDGKGLIRAHQLMTRFLIRATFGDVNDDKQADRLSKNRRIGVGHFGVQGFLAKNGIRYSEAPDNEDVRSLLQGLYQVVRDTARDYAFELRIPEPVKVTTVAPTGTIAKLAGRTEGIHPIFSRYFIRRVRFSLIDPAQRDQALEFAAQGYKVEDDLWAPETVVVEFPTKEALVAEVEDMGYPADIVESADEISFEDMLKFQALYQTCYADNAVSFTINVLPGSVSVERVQELLGEYLPVLKGTTIFPDLSRPQSPYERMTEAEYELSQNKSIADGVDENCAGGACPVK